MAYLGVRFSILSAVHGAIDIYHCKVHILNDSKSLKTELLTTAPISNRRFFDKRNTRFHTYPFLQAAGYVVQAAAASPSLLRNFVAFYFEPQKLIIIMVFMLHCDDNTLRTFGKKEKSIFGH